MAKWPLIDITAEGQRVKALAPTIISASRSTDIPAFYAKWFFNRLRIGFSVWRNPFSGVRSYISYDRTRFIVFWSKNPRPLLPYLAMLKSRGIHCYIQYTLNDYEQEGLERGVPPLTERIETYKMLVDAMGREGVVWRFDPLVLTRDITVGSLLAKAERIGDALRGYAEQLVFSYADIESYKKVKTNLTRIGVAYREWRDGDMAAFAAGIAEANRNKGWQYELATCCEPIDLSRYGITHNRCIDGIRIARIALHDEELMGQLKIKFSPSRNELVNSIPNGCLPPPPEQIFIGSHKKDPGQRPLCGCIAAKDIGEYNTCPHACVYCYANTSPETARANWRRHLRNPNESSITGQI